MRRVLFLTYYYPPSGGPGVQRPLKWSRYLPAAGWQPTVVTVEPDAAAYPALDAELLREIPPSAHVERTGAWDPYAAYATLVGKPKHEAVGVGFGGAEASWKERVARWMRANVFLPDARVGWVPFAVRAARRVLAETPHDALITTGPPHSTHLAGWLLARQTGLPWLADFRDPWTEIDYRAELPQTSLAARLDAALERAVLRRADAVTAVSPRLADGLRRRHARDYHVVMNGYDPADFAGDDVQVDGDVFYLTYVGNINPARNPVVLWRALQRLDAPRAMPRLRVRFVGAIDPIVEREAEAHGVAGIVEVQPYVPHSEAVRLMQESALLLLVVNRVDGAEGILTGKVFEYLASGRPTLGLGPARGDAADALRDAHGGTLVDWDDADAVARLLEAHYAAWQAGTPADGAPVDRLGPYSRVGQAEAVARMLDALVAPGTPERDPR